MTHALRLESAIGLMPGAKAAAIDRHLFPGVDQLVAASDVDWESSPFDFRPPQTVAELEEEITIQDTEFPDGTASRRVLRSLAMYADVHPVGDAKHHFTVHAGLDPRVIHPAVHLNNCRQICQNPRHSRGLVIQSIPTHSPIRSPYR